MTIWKLITGIIFLGLGVFSALERIKNPKEQLREDVNNFLGLGTIPYLTEGALIILGLVAIFNSFD